MNNWLFFATIGFVILIVIISTMIDFISDKKASKENGLDEIPEMKLVSEKSGWTTNESGEFVWRTIRVYEYDELLDIVDFQ